VYLANGCQIISPHDSKIQKEIDNNLKPWDNVWNLDNLKSICVLDELESQYMDLIKSLIFDKSLFNESNLKDFKLTYTSLHG
jgi:phosphoglucomutase